MKQTFECGPFRITIEPLRQPIDGHNTIIQQICNQYHITSRQLFSRRRSHLEVLPRQHCWALLKAEGHTVASIAQLFNKSYDTIRRGIQAHNNRNKIQ